MQVQISVGVQIFFLMFWIFTTCVILINILKDGIKFLDPVFLELKVSQMQP